MKERFANAMRLATVILLAMAVWCLWEVKSTVCRHWYCDVGGSTVRIER